MGLFNKTDDTKNDAKKTSAKSKKEVSTTKVEEGSSDSMKDLYSATESKSAKKGSVKKTTSGQAYRVLVKPMVTEKATTLNSVNQYVFMVETTANKISVAKAIEEVYGVKPSSVNVIKMKGKKINRGRITGKRKDFKKAIVTLKKGESISIYEGV